MGRPRLDDGLDPFFEWMVIERKLSMNTARAYTSNMRGTLRILGKSLADQDALNKHFVKLGKTKSVSTYSNGRRAYDLYRTWAETKKGVSLPELSGMEADSGEVVAVQPLPEAVRGALTKLNADQGISIKILAHLRWSEVHAPSAGQSGKVHIESPDGSMWVVPEANIEPILAYADHGYGSSAPFVPTSPGGHTLYPYRLLLQEVQKAQGHRSKGTPVWKPKSDGSALGASGALPPAPGQDDEPEVTPETYKGFSVDGLYTGMGLD